MFRKNRFYNTKVTIFLKIRNHWQYIWSIWK